MSKNANSALQLNMFEPVEQQVRPANGNTKMVAYGIQTDGSDFRIHVGYKTQHIYVFPTVEGRRAIERHPELEIVYATQPGVGGINTGGGYKMPLSFIDGMQSILIPHDIYAANVITKNGMSTAWKGHKALRIAVSMIKRNLIRLPLQVSTVEEHDLQIKGADIIVRSELVLQVKCDFGAGERQHGGTGNIFLQVAECNPRRYH